MKRRARKTLAAAASVASAYAGASWLAARALAGRLVSAQGLGPPAGGREELLAALTASGASVSDMRHPGSARSPVRLATIFATPGEPSGRATILFLHGKGGGSGEWRPDSLRALALGYNVLVPDLRGHPPSEGAFVTYGFLEKDDLSRAIAAARERFGIDPARLGVHGCSAGATVALEFTAGRDDVKALWLESPYAEPAAMARRYLALVTRLPEWLLTLTAHWAMARAVGRIASDLGVTRAQAHRDRVDPLRAMGRVRCPVALVHGTEDLLVPPRFGARLEQALPRGSSAWEAVGAGHCHHENEPAKVLEQEYRLRWTRFFQENLPVRTNS